MSEIPRSADLLVDQILAPGVLEQIKNNPEDTLRKLAAIATKHLPPPPLVRDSGIYYMVVGALGLVCVTVAIGSTVLSLMQTTVNIPDIMTALGSAAIGALAGLLAPSPAAK